MNDSLEMIRCTKCRNNMPKLRLDSYGYDFCIACSTVSPKVGRIRVVGEGDYTATELDIVDQDTARRLQQLENVSRGVRNVPLEILNYDEDEISDDAKILEAVLDKVIEDDLEAKVDDSETDEEDTAEVDDLELNDDDED
jgi:hypothetical protein